MHSTCKLLWITTVLILLNSQSRSQTLPPASRRVWDQEYLPTCHSGLTEGISNTANSMQLQHSTTAKQLTATVCEVCPRSTIAAYNWAFPLAMQTNNFQWMYLLVSQGDFISGTINLYHRKCNSPLATTSEVIPVILNNNHTCTNLPWWTYEGISNNANSMQLQHSTRTNNSLPLWLHIIGHSP